MKVVLLLSIIAAIASADESIRLSGGEPLLVTCQGKSIEFTIPGHTESWNLELHDAEGCITTQASLSNSIDRLDNIVFEAVPLPLLSPFKTQVIGDLIIMVPANQSKFAVVITKPY